MPTYDYKCDNCGHEFEIFQSMKDDKLTLCPECGKKKLKRLIGGGSGLIFKGSGFYLTDYKNKNSNTSSGNTAAVNSAQKKESATAKTDSDNSGEKTVKDTKPAAKSDKKAEKKQGS